MNSHPHSSNPANASRAEFLVAHRMLDANLNRAFEGLRTLEDIARFQGLGIAQKAFKQLRHHLQSTSHSWDVGQLLASRNADADVGREVKVPEEVSRPGGFMEIASAAAQRLQQSLRCLEEVAKFQYPSTATAIEKIRYQAYDLAASLLLSQQRDLEFLRQVTLYVLVDCRLSLASFAQRIADISQAGTGIIQIRDKQADAKQLIQYTQAALDAVAPSATRIVVNDRADVVQCSSAWGVHVGQTDLTVPQARSLVRPNCVVGLSTHDLAQVKGAIECSADYIGCGPTFPSTTKSFEAFSGLEFLRQVAQYLADAECNLPAFAIGGIDLSNLDALLETGVTRVAVSSAVWNADQPGRAAELLWNRLSKAG